MFQFLGKRLQGMCKISTLLHPVSLLSGILLIDGCWDDHHRNPNNNTEIIKLGNGWVKYTNIREAICNCCRLNLVIAQIAIGPHIFPGRFQQICQIKVSQSILNKRKCPFQSNFHCISSPNLPGNRGKGPETPPGPPTHPHPTPFQLLEYQMDRVGGQIW